MIRNIQRTLPDAMVLKLDPNYKQGIPDLLVLNGDRWAALEVKRHKKARHQPNQDYYVDRMNKMSYARFIYPENMEEVMNEIQQILTSDRTTRNTKSKR